ncbi:hypothetical protein GCM10022381_18110 [Leifsonia kafniensis]|uniref:SGNH domain-containing protein n=1 Tax=Leifsonia kafniensis TaxID=475957 RepID=A0ABP7KHI4_9MICO
MLGITLAGCSAPEGAHTPQAPQLGTASLDPGVKDMTVLVVGDSLARAFGSGMSEVVSDRNVTVVNAAIGGCGIMLPSQQMVNNVLTDATECNQWPTEWPALLEQYQPDVVYLTTAFWDAAKQMIDDSGEPKNFEDAAFRLRYAQNVDQVLSILTSTGATVYMDNMAHDTNYEAQVDAVTRNADAGLTVKLIDVYGQMCVSTGDCPWLINGIKVLDETGHPAGESRDRLARFILNQMKAGLTEGSK